MAEVIFSSSYDEANKPNNIFISNRGEFFSSTGMYPQELCVQFETERIVKTIAIASYGIKKIEIHTCENDSAVNFTLEAEQSGIPASGSLQNINLNLNKGPRVKVLKIVVIEGHEDFFSIQNVNIS